MNKDIKDGFDLIEYPHEFVFKAMCLAGQDSESILSGLVTKFVEPARLLGVSIRQSKTAKYESISLKVSLENRQELESIYSAIANHKSVVMTL